MQCLGQRIENLSRGPDVAPLFQPRVPRGPDTCEKGNLFTAKPWRAPPETFGKADGCGRQTLSAGAQEIPELPPASVKLVSPNIHHLLIIAVLIP
jgi:hypothetical protein